MDSPLLRRAAEKYRNYGEDRTQRSGQGAHLIQTARADEYARSRKLSQKSSERMKRHPPPPLNVTAPLNAE
jgi:hypothetical protein